MPIADSIKSYHNTLRMRACGVLVVDKQILLIKHQGLGELNHLWIPPGGGIELGETIKETIKREFQEETNLTISVEKFVAIHEYIALPLHAIEVFHSVNLIKGELKLGTDPELNKNAQFIKEVRFFSLKEIEKMDKRFFHPFVLSKKVRSIL